MPPLTTVRIPELLAAGDPLSLEDRLPIWISATNKTRHTTLSELRTLIETGGGGVGAPVVAGNTVYHKVTALEAGGTVISKPELAGKGSFRLDRDGVPMFPEEFNVLAGGGFSLAIPGDILYEGQRFVFELYELAGGGSTPGSGSGTFINGRITVSSNLIMNAATDIGKLLQVRADDEAVTITLPDVSTVTDNGIVPIETAILNSFQCKVETSGGQFIYLNNQGLNSVYMGLGETLWLIAGGDGWYVINDFGKIYQEVGKIDPSYKVGLNDLLLDGRLVSRLSYPRLWAWVLTLGDSLVTDAVWNTASVTVAGRTVERPYRGCFSLGNGSTTFRLPDLQNLSLRGLKSTTGTDTERHLNKPGGFQKNEVISHNHAPTVSGQTYNKLLTVDGSSTLNDPDTTPPGEPNLSKSQNMLDYGGAETRMDNAGVYWTIKA